MQLRAAALLAFVSGFVALGYEILWARRLSDLIGATGLAQSLVVGTFFVLLAAGAIVLGPLATRHRSPWRLYAALEAGILLAVLPAFFGDALAHDVARTFGDLLLQPGTSLAVKGLLALLFVGPASFCMGGTLPAMGQAVVRTGRLGHEGNLLYGVNTLGAALGILTATFALVPALGMRRSFLVLMAGSAALALVALRLAGRDADAARTQPSEASPAETPLPAVGTPSRRAWGWLAFFSGFNVLGLEILALHLCGQVLHNSTYTFATVLVVVIASLAVGALVTPRLALDPAGALRGAGLALLATALVTAVVPRIFFAATGGLQPLGGGSTTLGAYVARTVALAALVLGPSFVLAGWVFPLVLAGAEPRAAIGARWGRLLATNAAGALLGSVLANGVCMPALGLWLSISMWALAAAVAGFAAISSGPPRGRRPAFALAGAAALALVATVPAQLRPVALAPGDEILAWRAGSDGVGAVIATPGPVPDRRIKWNNTYTLGGTANAAQQARMGQLALLLHPAPRRAGFIGIATGITAGSALRDPAVQRVTAVELSPVITDLACRHFADANGDLCGHEHVRVVVEDGRTFFAATRDTFDVVVGDLFVPWQAGTATLYTREHFEAVRARLAPGGLFAQWLPLFQLDAVGFWGIAATFTAVFPNAWLAIADFQPYNPALALVGWRDTDGAPSAAVLQRRCTAVRPLERLREPMLADPSGVASFLVGPLRPVLPAGLPLLTLDRVWLADHAPRVQRARPELWYVGPPLVAALQRVAAACPDDTLRPAIAAGQQLYEFCERVEREGIQRAARWFDSEVTGPLPILPLREPERFNWPFQRDPGLFLLERARERRQRSGPPPDQTPRATPGP
jgi:spermidine synthase